VRSVAFIDHAGRRLTNALQYTVSIWTMVYVSIRSGLGSQKQQSFIEILKVISSQIYFTGFQALPIISMLALITGTLIIIQTSAQLSKVGGGEMLGNLLVVLIIRELGPLITALVVIARSGTAVASEIGNMKVNSEIEALESMGINPLSYIVFPRLVGGIISVVCLAFYFCIFALFGGYFMSQIVHPIAFSFYMDSIAFAVSRADVFLFLAKNIFSGAAIFIICCHQGLTVKQSFTEVPQVTTRAVVNSILVTVTFSTLVSLMVYLRNLQQLGIL
jgi:phospholipid/cholesterol/gamma-HCH transport system permease protein